MRRSLLFLLIFAVAAVIPAAAANIHVIFAIDTDDPYIGDSVRKDMNSVEEMLSDAADRADMGFFVQRFIDEEMTTDNVARAVRELEPDPNDMVVFYYSGHGFRTGSADTKYPFLSMEGADDLELYWVFEQLYSKNPRLLITMADACNNIIPDEYTPDDPDEKSRVEGNVTNNYRALFREASGAIIASSSIAGQYSQALQDGGAFTLEWLASIREAAASTSPTWPAIMDDADEPILFFGGDRQDPQFDFVERGVALSEELFEYTGPNITDPEGEQRTYTGRLSSGDPTTGSGHYYDSYLFETSQDENITIAVNSSSFDTYLTVLAADGSVVAENDDFEQTNSRLAFSAPADGEYEVRVSSYSAGEQGAYELLTFNVADLGLPAIDAEPTVTETAEGELRGELTESDETDEDGTIYDVYSFTGNTGDDVSIRVRSTDFDTFLRVVTPEDQVLENDDFERTEDGMGFLDSGLDIVLPASGEYFVYVQSYFGDAAGRYAVNYRGPGELSQAGVGGVAASGGSVDTVTAGLTTSDPQLGYDEYYHQYAFDGNRGDQVRIRLDSDEFDAWLVLESPAGDWDNQNDDAGDGSTNSELVLTLSQTGTYYIYATTYGGEETGSYELTTENISGLRRVD